VIHLSPEGLATAIAAAVSIVAVIAAGHRRAARREALRQYQRREQTPAVRRMVADILEDCNVHARRS
jgi:hypothetical protein